MHLQTPIYKSIQVISFKRFTLAFFFILFLNSASAQVKMKEHKALVKKSRADKTSLVSLDTLFCSGVPISKVSITNKIQGKTAEQMFIPFGSNTPVLIVNIFNTHNQLKESETFHNYNFPGLGLSCNVIYKNENEPYDFICKYDLINSNGLDTVKAEMFTTIRSSLRADLKSKLDTAQYYKSIIVTRDTTAPILVEEENLAQGGVLIGTFKEKSIAGPNGELKQYEIKNSIGALICTATRNDESKGSWSLLTYKNNRYYSITIVSKDELNALLKYLITNGFI